MSKKEVATFSVIVTIALFLNLKPFSVLFDSSVTHSFMSALSALQLDLKSVMVETNYRIKSPND